MDYVSKEYLALTKEIPGYTGRDPYEIGRPVEDSLTSATYLYRLHQLYYWIKKQPDDGLGAQIAEFLVMFPQHNLSQLDQESFINWRAWLCYIEWDVSTRFGKFENVLMAEIVSMFL